jgi:ABC-2 type transport system ATP-binding protein
LRTIRIDDIRCRRRLIDIITVARCRLCSADNDNIIVPPVRAVYTPTRRGELRPAVCAPATFQEFAALAINFAPHCIISIMPTTALHTPTDRPALRASRLHKVYGSVTALDGVSFTVNRGEIVGLLGPNGAGKTTTINMVLGVLAATTGSVEIDGIDISRQRARALARTNFAAVYAALPGNLTVIENLRFFGLLYGIESLRARVEELLQQFDLAHLRHTKCGLLSSGEQTRAALAKALLNRPQLLLLDEPTASLDPSAAQLIRAKIKRLATEDRCGILWTSHNMNEVEAVCDRVLFLSRGKVLLEGNPQTLPQEHGSATLEDLFIRVAREPLKAIADVAT